MRTSSLSISSPSIGFPAIMELASVTLSGSLKWWVARTMAEAVVAGCSDLKIPEPTKTPSIPCFISSAASAGVAIPPAEKVTTGSLLISRTSPMICTIESWHASMLPNGVF